jgi:hypothetical protein
MKLRKIKSLVLKEAIRIPGYPGTVEFHSEEARVETSFEMMAEFESQVAFVREKRLGVGTFVVPFGNVRYLLLEKEAENFIRKVDGPDDFRLEDKPEEPDPFDVPDGPGTPIIRKTPIHTKKA